MGPTNHPGISCVPSFGDLFSSVPQPLSLRFSSPISLDLPFLALAPEFLSSPPPVLRENPEVNFS